jgi:hypothetical protein
MKKVVGLLPYFLHIVGHHVGHGLGLIIMPSFLQNNDRAITTNTYIADFVSLPITFARRPIQ